MTTLILSLCIILLVVGNLRQLFWTKGVVKDLNEDLDAVWDKCHRMQDQIDVLNQLNDL